MEHWKSYDSLKQEIASELGINLKPGYNGQISAKDAGKLGGVIGGNMVRSMVEFAEEEMSKRNK
jgi:hypothetical protein